MTTTTKTRYYASLSTAGASSGICLEGRTSVLAFATRAQRDSWVARAGYPERGLRSPLTTSEARDLMRRIMESAVGGVQDGREALRQVATESGA